MSEFFAEAFVKVKPSTKGFTADLRAQLANTEILKKGIRVPVLLEPKAFKKSINAELRAAKFTAKVTPDVQGFRDKLLASVQGVSIPIRVVPLFDKTALAAEAKQQASLVSGIASQELAGLVSRAAILGPAGTSIPPATQIPAGGSTRRGSTGGGGTGAADTQAAAAAKKLTAEQRVRDRVVAKLTTTQLAFVEAMREELAPAQRVSALTAALEKAEAARSVVLNRLGEAQTANAKALVATLTPLQEQANELVATVETSLQLAAAEESVDRATRKLNKTLAVNIDLVQTKTDLTKIDNTLSSATRDLEAAKAKAISLDNAALDANIGALEAQVAAQQKLVAAQKRSIGGQAAHARQLAQASRGAGATALSFLGLRGATLAASGAFLAGAAALVALTKSLGEAVQFNRTLAVLRATSGATADEMKQVSLVSRQLGADITLPSVSASDAADAILQLSKAGLTLQDSMDGARGVLQLATAAGIDNAAATKLAADALNAFSLAGTDATHVADVFANAANASQGEVTDFGTALEQSAAVAHQAGISFDDTLAILSLFARAGLSGSDAGTSLRTALIRLIAPTKQANKELEALHIHVRDATGAVRPDVFAQFGRATKNLGPDVRDAAAALIFGQDAIRAVAIGARAGTSGLSEMRRQIGAQGTAARLAAAQTTGLSGSVEQLKNDVAQLGLSIGQIAIPGAKGLVSAFDLIARGAEHDIEDIRHFSRELKSLFGIHPETQKLSSATGRVASDLSVLSSSASAGLKDQSAQIQILSTDLGDLAEKAKKTGGGFEQAFLHSTTAAILFGKETNNDTQQAERFNKKFGDLINSAGVLSPELSRNVELLKEFVTTVGHVPSKVEIDLILHNKNTKAQLQDLVPDIKALGPQAAADAEKVAEQTGVAFKKGFKNIAPGSSPGFDALIGTGGPITPKLIQIGQKAGADTASSTVAGFNKRIKSLQQAVQASLEVALAAPPDSKLQEAAVAQVKGLLNKIKALGPQGRAIALTFGAQIMDSLAAGLETGQQKVLQKFLEPFQLGIAKAQAFGGAAAQISSFQAESAALLKLIKNGKLSRSSLIQALQEFASAKSSAASIAQQQTQKAQAAQDKIDQAVLDSFSTREQTLQNALTVAQGTASLRDDIRVTRALAATYVQEIATAKARITDAKKRNDTILSLQGDLAKTNQDLADLEKQAFEKIFTDRQDALNTALQLAQGTPSLIDDIRITKALQASYRREIAQAKQRVKDATSRNAIIKDTRAKLVQLNQDLVSLRQQQAERFKSSLQLDVDLANTIGNISGEIRAREALIKELRKEQRQVKRGTVEWKQLRNDIAEEEKAIKDLKKENDDKKDAMRSLAFSFLQTQQGFAANLFGNLIPQGFTRGLVGNQSPTAAISPVGGGGGALGGGLAFPGGASSGGGGGIIALGGTPAAPSPSQSIAATAAANIASGGTTGMTAAQAATLIKLMHDLVSAVRHQNRGSAHPEAAHQRQAGYAAMELGSG